jgi:hypothetical protein
MTDPSKITYPPRSSQLSSRAAIGPLPLPHVYMQSLRVSLSIYQASCAIEMGSREREKLIRIEGRSARACQCSGVHRSAWKNTEALANFLLSLRFIVGSQQAVVDVVAFLSSLSVFSLCCRFLHSFYAWPRIG